MHQQTPNNPERLIGSPEQLLKSLEQELIGAKPKGTEEPIPVPTRLLDMIYQTIDERGVERVRQLSKKKRSSFVNAVLGTFGRSGLKISKQDAQLLFGVDPITMNIPDMQLPNRSQHRAIFTERAEPISEQEVRNAEIAFDDSKMTLIVNGEFVAGKDGPFPGERYSIYQILRNPYKPEELVIRNSKPIIDDELLIDINEKGIYLATNKNEAFSLEGKTLVFL